MLAYVLAVIVLLVAALLAFGLAALMIFVNLLFWGPLPAAWLWVGAQVDYNTDSVSGGIAVSFVGMMLTLIAALAVLKRLDHVWILVRRAAGYDQRSGVRGRVFGATAAVCAVVFVFWFVVIHGPGSNIVSGGGNV